MSEDQVQQNKLGTGIGSNRLDTRLGVSTQVLQQDPTYEPIQSAATPPKQLLQPRMPTKETSPVTPAEARKWTTLPPTTKFNTGKNTYDEVIPVEERSDQDGHLYLMVKSRDPAASDTDTRLQQVEELQTELCREFSQFKTDITTEIFSLKEMIENLTKLVQETSTNFKTTLETIQFKMLENSDHLGKQILDVRRDIVAAARKQGSTLPRPQTSTHLHTLECEVVNVDSMVKNYKEHSSQTYSIHHIGYNIHGDISCSRDGRLILKIIWEFPPSSNSPLEKYTKFDCTAHMVDKSGKQTDWIVGRVAGDFNNGNEWVVANVSVKEVKKKGYVTKSGNINLKLIAEIYY